MNKIIAPCGIDCFNCELYEENVTEEFQAGLSERTKIPKELLSCKGCTESNICLFLKMQGKRCKTRECADKKGVNYCYECNSFPCENLMPLADGAAKFPHNMKVYNLCRMKQIGIEEWVKEAGEARKTYYTKKLEIGEGGSK